MRMTEKSYTGWWFLLAAVIISAIVFLIKPESLLPSLTFFLSIIEKIIPIFVLIFILLVLVNYFIKPEWLVRKYGEKQI